jgi:hypothetical protein
MSESNAIAEQHAQVGKHKAAHMKRLQRNTKDIRGEIAHGDHYEPKDDPIYEYVPYPKWVTPEGGEPVIVNTKAEHDALLGIEAKPAKAVTIDVADLAKPDETVTVKRKYTKRAVAELPQTLE